MRNVSVVSMLLVLSGCAADLAMTVSAIPYYISYALVAWFVGAIIGGIISTFVVDVLMKDKFCIFSGSLLILSCIYKIIGNDITAISICRTVSGIGYGLLIIPSVIYAGEVSDKEFRGKVVSLVSLSQTIGFFILAFSWLFTKVDLVDGFRMSLAIIQMILAAAGIALSFFGIDSPVMLLKKGREPEALLNLKKIRNEPFITPNILNEIADMKDIIRDSARENTWSLSPDNLKPILNVIILQVTKALLNSPSIYLWMFNMTFLTVEDSAYVLIVVLPTLIMELITSYKIEDWGRRELVKGAFVPAAVCLIIFGILMYCYDVTLGAFPYLFLIIPYQIVTGMGVNQVATISMVEAFPKRKNSIPLLIALITEMITHLINIAFNQIEDYFKWQFFSIPVFIIIFGIILFKILPETKRLSLKACHEIYRL